MAHQSQSNVALKMQFYVQVTFFTYNSLFFADIITPEEQEQVFVASVHNLSKVAAILLKECTAK